MMGIRLLLRHALGKWELQLQYVNMHEKGAKAGEGVEDNIPTQQ